MKKNMNMNMGFNIPLKRIIGLLFLLISSALFSTSVAGRLFKPVDQLKQVSATHHVELEYSWEQQRHDEVVSEIHERLLKTVKTNDYGRYDPAPALVKPPFKLIPN